MFINPFLLLTYWTRWSQKYCCVDAVAFRKESFKNNLDMDSFSSWQLDYSDSDLCSGERQLLCFDMPSERNLRGPLMRTHTHTHTHYTHASLSL